MQLHDVVETSRRVGETSGRLEKIGHIASCLRRAEPELVETVVALLARLLAGKPGRKFGLIDPGQCGCRGPAQSS